MSDYVQVQEAGSPGTEDPCEESERDGRAGQTEAAEGRTGSDGGVVGEEEQGADWCQRSPGHRLSPCNIVSCPFLTSLAVSFYLSFLIERRSLMARVAACHWNIWTTAFCRLLNVSFCCQVEICSQSSGAANWCWTASRQLVTCLSQSRGNIATQQCASVQSPYHSLIHWGINTFSMLVASRVRHWIIIKEFKEFRTDFSMSDICDAQVTVPLWIGERLFVRLVNVKYCCE